MEMIFHSIMPMIEKERGMGKMEEREEEEDGGGGGGREGKPKGTKALCIDIDHMSKKQCKSFSITFRAGEGGTGKWAVKSKLY